MTSVTATDLRQRLYRLLDQVLETGEPLTIKRGNRFVELRAVASLPESDRLSNLISHPGTIVRPETPLDSPWDESAWQAKWNERLG